MPIAVAVTDTEADDPIAASRPPNDDLVVKWQLPAPVERLATMWSLDGDERRFWPRSSGRDAVAAGYTKSVDYLHPAAGVLRGRDSARPMHLVDRTLVERDDVHRAIR